MDFGSFKWGEGDFRDMDRDEIMGRTRDALDVGQDWLTKVGKQWQGDTPDDALARGMVAAATMQLSDIRDTIDIALDDPSKINPLILALAIQGLETSLKSLAMLDSLAGLAGKRRADDEDE